MNVFIEYRLGLFVHLWVYCVTLVAVYNYFNLVKKKREFRMSFLKVLSSIYCKEQKKKKTKL